MGNNSHLAGLLTGPARPSHSGLARRAPEGSQHDPGAASHG